MLLHQSDLAALSRCMAEYGYKRAGMPMKTNSRAVYGSVMHHALTAGERALATGSSRSLAVHTAVETFNHYWMPQNTIEICEPVPADGWLARDRWGSMREKGVTTIKQYFDLDIFDDIELLGTEYSFIIPIPGTWDEDLEEPHHLAGSIDRFGIRHYKRISTVTVDDYKSGVDQTYLRHNCQGTAYCLASTLPEFWTGYRGEDGFGEDRGMELYERFIDAPRRFTWISLRGMKFADGGWRGPQDYQRFALAVEQFAALIKAEVFPMTLTGQACKFCDARSVCGGIGVPADDHGAPPALANR